MLTYPSSGWDDDTRPTGNVEFPETVTYNGTTYTVTGISGTAFYNCTGITSITIPNTITSISLYAFAYCTSLSSFNIPSSVTTLYGDSFIYTAWYNNQLDGVICKDGWCLGYKGTPSGSLVIPAGTSRVANSAFSGCSGFTGTLSLPNSLTVIGASAFSGCSGLSGSIVIPNSVVSIGNSAFSECSGFAGTLTFGNSLTTIGNHAFSGCTKLSGISPFPNTMVSIGDYAFEHCRKIASALVFPSTLESIGLLAFEGCWLATSVTLPGPSTSIGDYAFRYCTGLVSVNIGANIIPEDAFYNCTSLSSLTLQNTVTQIKDGAFQNCSPLSNVDIPSSVVSIGDFAFANTGLTNVTIPSSVYSLGDGVFKNTAWYNNQPDGAYYASNCCLGYKGDKPTGALTIAANTRLIAGNSFFQCVGLTSVSFPNTLTRICYQAFFGCSGLSSVVLPNSCAHLGYGAFEQCSGLTSISLGEQMAFMAEYAFYNCPNIAEIYSYAITPPWLGYCVFCNTSYSIPVYVPSGSVSSYQSADGWSSFTNYHGIGGTNYYTISVSASPSDGGTVTGGGSYNNGSSCTLTATANSGYTFNNWTENGTVVSTNASYTFTVTGNRTLVANFTANPVYYTVNVSANPSNGGTVSGGGSYTYGSACMITATANSGYTFVNWTENGNVVCSTNTYYFGVVSNRTFVANFTANGSGGDHSYVDLGLPSGILWATCNVGADTPEEYGDYFAWGETQPKESYSWSTYQFCNGSENTLTKYCNNSEYGYNGFTDNLIVLLPEDDAATANWGENWRMPTSEEFEELCNSTTVTWVTQNGVNGRLFTASNGNSLFLPAAGYYYGSCLDGAGNNGRYWSSSLYLDNPSYTLYFFFQWDYYVMGSASRYYGRPIRAVRFTSQNSCLITATSNSSAGGTVSGAGTYNYGSICTLIATANSGYSFSNWTENGTVVSTSPSYAFTVTSNRTLVANFTANGSGGDHGYVDLGLPSGTMWATCNIGADTPEGYGDYFAWGETQPKDYYDWSTYQYSNGGTTWQNPNLTKYCNNSNYGYNGFTDDLATLLPEDDAATANWGADWRMPTKEELEELYNNTTCTWTQQNGVNGRLFTASNGNSLFLPAAGCRNTNSLNLAGSNGYYWSGSLGTEGPYSAWTLSFYSDGYDMYYGDRYFGRSVRAVRSAPQNLSFDINAIPNPAEGGTIEGAGTYEQGQICTLTATPNIGYSFVRWTKNGSQVSTNPTYSFTVTENASYVAVFEQSTVTHSQTLTNGWNWWSSYVELNGSESLTQLENSLGSAGLIIKSRSDGYVESYQYNGTTGWFGSLTSICNEQMYVINTNTSCSVAVTGFLANSSNHPITIHPGWNWIGYVSSIAMDINTAFANIAPTSGDKVKSYNQGYVDYYPGYGWFGSLNTITPGMGLMYYSANNQPVTLTYPSSAKCGELKPNLTPEDNVYRPIEHQFAYNMTVTAVIEADGEELRSESHELAAFVGDDCRGSVRLIYVEPIDRYVAFLTVFGASGDALEFRLTDGRKTQISTDMLVFAADGMEGTLASPKVLHFGTLGVGETSAMVRIYPNPVRSKGTLNIALPDTSERLMVEISNMLGVTVFRGEVLVEPTSVARITLPDAVLTGTYVLKATAHDGTVYYGKLVVE